MRGVRIAYILPLLAACSDRLPVPVLADAAADARVDVGTDAAWRAPETPRIPWLAEGLPPIAPAAPPLFTPCPTGWREVADGDLVTCEPWPEGHSEACADDEAHFPGESGCRRIGTACPADGWPADLPVGVPILWVRAGSAPGDGQKTNPFATISAAVAAAEPGTVIALGAGVYDEGVTLDMAGLELVGACVAGTRVAASAPSEYTGTITVIASGVGLSNFSLGGARPGLWVSPAGSVRVTNVVVAGAEIAGVGMDDGGTLRAETLAVRDTKSRRFDRRRGRGLNAEDGAQVEIARAVFERNRDSGIFALGAGTTVLLSDVAVRETRSRERDQIAGRGLEAQGGAYVEVVRGVFEENRDISISADDAGTTVLLSDVTVRDTQSLEIDRTAGSGLDAEAGASVEVLRAVFERNRFVGVYAGGANTTVVLSDVVVRDTQGQESDRTLGRGVGAEAGARVEVARAIFERNRDVGVSAIGAGTTVLLSDVAVRATQSQESDGEFGRGLAATAAARVDVTRAIFERNRDVAVFAARAGAMVVISDAVVRDTQSQESDGRFGRGLSVQDGAGAQVRCTLFERNREVAVFAYNAGTSVQLEDVAVRDTMPADCVDRCVFGAGGMGVGSYDAAGLVMSRFVVQRSALCGAQVALNGTLDLAEGEIRQSVIGACVQVPGYRLSRGMSRSVLNFEAAARAMSIPSSRTAQPRCCLHKGVAEWQ